MKRRTVRIKTYPKRSQSFYHLNAHGYRSGLEKANQDLLNSLGVPFTYEGRSIPFLEPAKKRHYTPDFFLANGIIIETKGRFLTKDRQKHLLVRDQYPDLEIRFVFSRAKSPIYKRSKTTHAKWAEKYNFQWAEKLIPVEWINEQAVEKWLDAIAKLKTK